MAENIPDDELERRIRTLDKQHLQESARFLAEAARKLNWGDLSDSDVMDIGCGIEFNVVFLYLFPNYRRIIGIDNDEDNIFYLQNYRASTQHNVTYHLADIRKWNSVSQWEGQLEKITSFFCLNCIDDKNSAFQNIYRLLKPGGEVIIIAGLNNPYYDCLKYLTDQDPWKEYKEYLEQFPEHANENIGMEWYVNTLRDIGFEVLFYKEFGRRTTFPSREEFDRSELTRDDFLVQFLDANMVDEFRKQYREGLISLNGRTENTNLLCLRFRSFHLAIKKGVGAQKKVESGEATGSPSIEEKISDLKL